MASDVADLAGKLSVSSADLNQSVNTGVGLAQAGDKLQALQLQNQQAQMDIANKQLSGSLSMANTYLRANDTVRKQMRGQLADRAQKNGAPINGLLDAFDADPTLGRQWLIQSQQPGFNEKIRNNPFLANQIAASDDVLGVQNHLEDFLATAKGEQANAGKAEIAGIKADSNEKIRSAQNDAQLAKIDAKNAQGADSAQNKAFQFTQTQLESARGNGAVQQAQKDIYAADKFGSLVNLYGDANKLNPAQVQLAASEVAKIAQGGVPSQHELAGLTPQSIPGGLAKIAQVFTNEPSAANQGAFINALSDYTTSLKRDAQAVVKDKFSRVLETNRKRIGDDNYNLLHDNYVKPLMGDEQKAEGPKSSTSMLAQGLQGARAAFGAQQDESTVRQKLQAKGFQPSEINRIISQARGQ